MITEAEHNSTLISDDVPSLKCQVNPPTKLPCNTTCSKCGSDDISLTFRIKGSTVDSIGYNKKPNKYTTGQCHYWETLRDHIDYICRCCQHRWQSLPLPKKKNSKQSNELKGQKMIKKLGKDYPDKDLTPEHTKRGNGHDDMSDSPIHPDVHAAYDYVQSVLDTSDFKDEYAWHGWGIREAFLAGASYEHKNPKLQKTEDWHEDIGDCLFFHFSNFEEPPSVCCASPMDDIFDEDYWTHFIKPDFNSIFDQAQVST